METERVELSLKAIVIMIVIVIIFSKIIIISNLRVIDGNGKGGVVIDSNCQTPRIDPHLENNLNC